MNAFIRHPNRVRDERGMSLLEVTVLLAALVIVTAALAPTVLRVIHDARQDETRDELQALHRAIVGSDADHTWGYMGDMGRLPVDLTELGIRGSQPLYATSEISGVGFGWNGPYVTRGADADDYYLDPWGTPYDIGIVGAGQIRSAGPDGLFDDGDDIVYPPVEWNPYGTLLVSVKGHEGDLITVDPDGCTVTVSYSDSGTESTVVDSTAPFSFSGLHRGLHQVVVECPAVGGTAIESAVVGVPGQGAQQAIELHVTLGTGTTTTTSTDVESETDGASDAAESRQE